MEILLGAVVVALTLIIAVGTIMARAGRPLGGRVAGTTRTRTALMAVLSVLAALLVFPSLVPGARQGIFSFCGVCPVGTVATGGPESLGGFLNTFFLAAWYYTATVLPVFVLACLLSGVLLARSRRFPIRGVLPAFGVAALLPVCSCGVIPIGKTMIERGGTGARDGLVFIATAPLLSPIIALLAVSLLGWGYLVLRVVASLVLAVAVAVLVRPFLRPPVGATQAPGTGEPRQGPAVSQGPAAQAATPPAGGSVLLAGWGMLTGLTRFVLFGVVMGALFASLLPADYVASVLRSGVASMAAVVVIGVPINMCAGEEIVLSAPLAGMGLTLGHALAFALASTGICMSSIPLLVNVLGRRAALVMVAVYLVVPFLLGIIVNALPFLGAFWQPPF
ncbi:MAG: permease [Candidatus Eisenbacteria bacterium]